MRCRADLSAQREAESARAAALREAVTVVLAYLELPLPDNEAGFADAVGQVSGEVGVVLREALIRGVHESFFLARAHYESIAWPTMVASGMPDGYTMEELDAI